MEALTGVSAGLLCALDMVKSFEKNESGQYPETRISDIIISNKYKSDSAVWFMEEFLLDTNMASTADLSHHFLEAVDKAAIASAE